MIVGALVATTAGTSAAGVELPTDDYRQPAGITDENSFFLFFYGGRPFFWGNFFFHFKNGAFYTKNGAFLHLLLVCTIFFVYIVYTLFVRVPSTVPSHHVLVPFHHGLPQNEVTMGWHEQLFPQLVVPICSCVCCVSILRCSTYARLKRIACRNACLTRI
jgi:hypothetical protein